MSFKIKSLALVGKFSGNKILLAKIYLNIETKSCEESLKGGIPTIIS